MTTIKPAGYWLRRQTVITIATDVVIVMLLLGAMMSAWAMAIAAGVALVGLVAYAYFSRDPARHKYVLLAAGTALAAAVVAAVVATR